MREWVVINKYGGIKFVRAEFGTEKEALDFVNSMLEKDDKRKNRGARLRCHVYRKFASYEN